MPLETATFIDDLVVTNPVGASDAKSFGDDHIRLIKTVLKNTFPNIDAAVNLTPTQANNWFTSGSYTMGDADLTFTWADDSASGIQADFYKNSASAAAADDLLLLDASGNNNAAEKTIYVRHIHRINDITDGSEDGEYLLQTMVNGALATRFQITPTEVLLDGASLASVQAFPSGTNMLFQQTAAPTGWTKDTTHNNKALRVVTGAASSGGTVAFTTAFASKSVAGTVGATALTTAQLAAHTHSVSGSTGTQSANHTHSFSDTATTGSGGSHAHSFSDSGSTSSAGAHTHSVPGHSGAAGSANNALTGSIPDDESVATTSAGAHTHTFSVSGTTSTASSHTHSVTVSGNTGSNSASHTHTFSATSGSAGSGSTHTHSFTGTDIDLAVQYVDLIIATKD